MMPALLPLEGLVELGTTRLDDVTCARAYVTARRVICRVCGEDDPNDLRFVYGHVDGWGRLLVRPRHRLWDVPLARLVQAGASQTRLAMEMAKCVVVCRPCQCRTFLPTLPRPQMLRSNSGRFDGVVAKAAIASCGGRNPEPRIVTRRSIESLSDRGSLTECLLTRL